MPKATYRLGTICQGSVYIHTALPEFATVPQALHYQTKRLGRQACDVIVCDVPAVRQGFVYGTHQTLLSAIDGRPLPTR